MHARAKTIFSAFLALSLALPASGQQKALELSTVVIDAGHGGQDPGAVSKDGKTREKDLTLSIARLTGKLIKDKYPSVKVVYTRSDDRYVTLNDRAAIANRNQANLFISIHINSVESRQPDGFSAHILGESSHKDRDLFAYNMNVCKKENSVILLEDDYSTKYQGFDPNDPESFIFFHLMQNAFYEQSLLFAADVNAQMAKTSGYGHNRGIHQDPFYVLWKTTMPAVLIEAGFISNSSDLAVMTSEQGKQNIAKAIADAFSVFKARYDGTLEVSGGETPAAVTATEPVKTEEEAGGKAEPVKEEQKTVVKAEENEPVEVDPEAGGKAEPVKVEETAVEKTEDGAAAVRYAVQVLASSRVIGVDDPYFHGWTPKVYKAGDINKYVLSETGDEARMKENFAKIREIFPESFMVRIEGEKIIFWGRRL